MKERVVSIVDYYIKCNSNYYRGWFELLYNNDYNITIINIFLSIVSTTIIIIKLDISNNYENFIFFVLKIKKNNTLKYYFIKIVKGYKYNIYIYIYIYNSYCKYDTRK